ncbi:MAG: CDP-alcohol phosphatidyltransferase family protein [Lachnospiraceae bacterium]|nr:CDP-alcohol phosphatidyltransferase family protein [Lachnospiraceae bacterium]
MNDRTETQTAKQDTGDIPVDRIWTVPNIMSFFRLLLIPVIMWVYLAKKDYVLVAVLLVISGITDVADGYVARHFNQVSNLGKMLDPIADKFTEGILMILLALRFPLMWMLVGVFAVGAFLMSFWGIRAINRSHFVNPAHWYGKITTVILYAATFTLLLWDSIPMKAANIIIVVCTLLVIGNVTMYGLFYMKLRRERLKQGLKK